MRANRPGRRPHSLIGRLAAAGLATWMVAAATAARGQEAPAAAGGPARYVAADDLVGYLEFRGLDANRDAWRQTAAAKLLDETGLGAMLRSVASQLAANAQAARPEMREAAGRAGVLVDRVLGSGFALGAHPGGDGAAPRVVLALAGLGRADARPASESALRGLVPRGARVEIVARDDGRKITYVRPASGTPWAYWFEADDLLLTFVEPESAAQAAIAAAEGEAESVLKSPRRAELASEDGGFRPVLLGFLDVEAVPLPPTPPELGLDGLKRIDHRWGFRGETLEGVTRVVAPAPRRGLLALLDQPTFEPGAAPVPADVVEYAVTSVDLARSLDTVRALARAIAPEQADQVDAALKQADAALGVGLKADLLEQLGPKVTAYVAPQTVRAPLTPFEGMASWIFHIPRLTVVFDVKDPRGFAPTLATLMDRANAELKRQAEMNGLPGVPAFRPIERGAAKGYALDLPPEVAPLPAGFRPAVLLGGRHLVVAVSPEAAAAALAVDAGAPRAVPPFADRLPGTLTYLGVTDPRVAMPDVLVNLPFFLNLLAKVGETSPDGPPAELFRVRVDPETIPTADAIRARMTPGVVAVSVDDRGLTVRTIETFPSVNAVTASPVAVALLLPAVQSARSAAYRAQSTNNMKQIALAMHNFHSVEDAFPAAAICDPQGKPLLSWRVAILPYLEQQALYEEFHLDEPWDSPHNKALIPRMPQVYAAPKPNAPKEATFYQVFVGNGAGFEKAERVSLIDVTDGTSNTLLAVEAGKAVPWTKPEDIPFDPDKPLPKFGGIGFPGGFNAGFMDGSVKFLKESIDPEVMKALITRAGGEVVDF